MRCLRMLPKLSSVRSSSCLPLAGGVGLLTGLLTRNRSDHVPRVPLERKNVTCADIIWYLGRISLTYFRQYRTLPPARPRPEQRLGAKVFGFSVSFYVSNWGKILRVLPSSFLGRVQTVLGVLASAGSSPLLRAARWEPHKHSKCAGVCYRGALSLSPLFARELNFFASGVLQENGAFARKADVTSPIESVPAT